MEAIRDSGDFPQDFQKTWVHVNAVIKVGYDNRRMSLLKLPGWILVSNYQHTSVMGLISIPFENPLEAYEKEVIYPQIEGLLKKFFLSFKTTKRRREGRSLPKDYC